MDNLTSEFRQLMEKYSRELRDLQQRAAVAESPIQTVVAAPIEQPRSFTAPLTVRVTAANEAIPIADALVIVTRTVNDETVVEASRITNANGLTESMSLAAVDPALTLRPGTVIPDILYDVSVSAPDYYRALIRRIPLYGGIPTELPVSLIPIPESPDTPIREIEYDTPPIDL